MSVIVAVKENGVVYFGADSQTTAGKRKYNYLNETGFKVYRADNGMLLGFCGRVGARQTILSVKDVFTLDERGDLTKRHIVTKIIPKLADKMEDVGNEESGALDVNILLGYKDKLYKITSALEVVKLNEYSASGAGEEFTHYALCAWKDMPVRERILKALSTSAKFEESVCGPYVLIDTENLEYEIVDLGGENH